jgi:tRNA-dihydrouridine synthase A
MTNQMLDFKTLETTTNQTSIKNHTTHRLCVAPMLDWTHRHCRYFHRLLAPKAFLYTEMITTGAIIHSAKRESYLQFNAAEQPLALQIGGSDLDDLAKIMPLIEQYQYDEININCGCPSERVQKGAFGACLMQTPKHVAQGVKLLKSLTKTPITLKHRIGIDDETRYEFLRDFVEINAEAGCQTFIIHARNAWLKGLSPKENREVPPLNYEYVYRIKQEFPMLNIVINGGLEVERVDEYLKYVDGVMFGRLAYHQPMILQQLSQQLWPELATQTDYSLSLSQIIDKMQAYSQEEVLKQGTYLGTITQPMLGLLHGRKNARLWRQHLSNHTLLRQIKDAASLEAFWARARSLIQD